MHTKKLMLMFSRVSHFATADEYTDTTLRVITIEKKQYGFYTCKAENKFGESEAKVELVGKCLEICRANYLKSVERCTLICFWLLNSIKILKQRVLLIFNNTLYIPFNPFSNFH